MTDTDTGKQADKTVTSAETWVGSSGRYAFKLALNPEAAAAWRRRSSGSVAVVAGSFDIFQPGNLWAIRRAAMAAERVFVMIEPDEFAAESVHGDKYHNEAAIRLEAATHLRDVAGVGPATANPAAMAAALQPFVFVHCPAQAAAGPAAQAALDRSAGRIEIAPIEGCFTRDVFQAVHVNRTPITLPANYETLVQLRPALSQVPAGSAPSGRPILVSMNGCFDVLHIGHLRVLAEARSLGDRLAVLVNDDSSVRAYKGHGRPVFPIAFRLRALAALEPVWLAIPFSGDTPLEAISRLGPDIHVKGGSYEEDRVRQERELLARWGGRIEFLPMIAGYNTTRMVNTMQNAAEPETRP